MKTNDYRIATFESGDQFFGILSEMSKHFVSARKKNVELLSALKRRGVAFKDIKSFLMNRAAEIGLWEKGRRESELSGRAWYVMLQTFMSWKSRNYTDYGVLRVKDPKKKPKSEDSTVKTTTKVRVKDKDGNLIEERESSSEETLRERVEKIKAQAKADAEAALLKPVTETLSVTQVQQVILQNFAVLGKICEEKHCVPEFNALMAALGSYEEMIGVDDPEVLAEAETLINAPVM